MCQGYCTGSEAAKAECRLPVHASDVLLDLCGMPMVHTLVIAVHRSQAIDSINQQKKLKYCPTKQWTADFEKPRLFLSNVFSDFVR